MKQDIILDVQDLRTEFTVPKGRVYAVNGVSFQLRRSKILGIVGESGCGKSVTAHSILQLLPRNGKIVSGRVTYNSPDGTNHELSAYKRNGKTMRRIRGRDIGMIFQNPLSSLNPVYTVGWQIAENLHQHEKISGREAKERIIDLLRKFGIPDPEQRYNEYPHQFSGGMKQRVMIAIAMICQPHILIADEPTTALDVTIQAQILDLMKRLRDATGTSIILITHNMGVVAETCDDVVVMYMGRIVESGTVEHIFNNPLHPYTQDLLRSVPVLGMNQDEDLATIEGQTPDAGEKINHCAFADRCQRCMPICSEAIPPDYTLEPNHVVQCWLYKDGEVAERGAL